MKLNDAQRIAAEGAQRDNARDVAMEMTSTELIHNLKSECEILRGSRDYWKKRCEEAEARERQVVGVMEEQRERAEELVERELENARKALKEKTTELESVREMLQLQRRNTDAVYDRVQRSMTAIRDLVSQLEHRSSDFVLTDWKERYGWPIPW